MPYWVQGLDTYYEEYKEFPKDTAIRKRIVKDWYIANIVASIEKCIADTSRILSDEIKKGYREKEYNTCCFYYDDNGLITTKNEAIWVKDKNFTFQDGGILADTRLIEYIYDNATIRDIYHLKHLEYIDNYINEYSSSLLALIYPSKMPTKDYFPFIEFDIGTKIPLLLTEEEKQRYKDDVDIFSNLEIAKQDWAYCIFWIDLQSMFISLDCNIYYFKQIDKNVHLFEITFQCV